MTVTILISIIVGIIFIAWSLHSSQDLKDHISINIAILFIFVIISNVITNLTGITFTALRKSEYYFIQNLMVSSKILIIFLLIDFGAMGIFGSLGLSFILAAILSFYLIARTGIIQKITIDWKYLSDSFRYSVGNYLVGLFQISPNLIIPIMVLDLLGAVNAAYYYVSYSVVTVLFMLPQSLSTSLFVEGSHGRPLRSSAIKSITAVFIMLIPSVIFLYFFGDVILGFFGQEYAIHGIDLFRILIFSSFLISINYIYSAILRIQQNVRELIALNGIIFIVLIVFGYLLMNYIGLNGIGYAWIISYSIGTLYIIINFAIRPKAILQRNNTKET